MKQTTILLSMLAVITLVGCGEDTKYIKEIVEVPVDVPVEVVVPQDFEGAYFMNNDSYIELTTSYDDDVIVETSNQLLVSKNPQNNTYAFHPTISGRYQIVNGELFFSRDVDYKDANQYDIEEDDSGADITGQHYTTFRFQQLNDGRIKLTISIYSGTKYDNLNYRIAKRVFTSSK